MIARYTRAAMARVFAEDTRLAHWLEVELALVEALEDANIAPRGAAATIRAHAVIDVTRMAAIEETVHHDVIAFLTQIGEGLGDEKRWLHFGITSSDLVDTAQALQLREAGRVLKPLGPGQVFMGFGNSGVKTRAGVMAHKQNRSG